MVRVWLVIAGIRKGGGGGLNRIFACACRFDELHAVATSCSVLELSDDILMMVFQRLDIKTRILVYVIIL